MDSQHGNGDNTDPGKRTLTERGLDLYRASVNTHSEKIELVQTEVELCLEIFSTTKQEDTNTLIELKKTLNLCYCKTLRQRKVSECMRSTLQQMKVSDKDEKASKLSHRSQAHSRTSSNSSSVAIRTRAKVEAAQDKLKFVIKEADLQKQKAYIEEQENVSNAKTFTKKAEFEAELELLNYKKETAAATVEPDALEYDQNVCSNKKSDLLLSKTVYERTNQNVEQQVLQVKDVKLPPDDNIVPCDPFTNQTSDDAVYQQSHMPTPKPSRPKYDLPCLSAGFVLGKTKLAPISGNTIPRLKICAAVMAAEIVEFVTYNLDQTTDTVKFYSDSRIVLGYVTNQTRLFYTYVANRVQRIRKSSSPEHWNFVSTQLNPADQGTKCIPADKVNSSLWILGHEELICKCEPQIICSETLNSSDGIVRKVRVRIIKKGKPVVYTCPVTELVLLVSEKNTCY
ncbi:unnamed protein product [Mytilus coruscus]|uniref:Uncharacterized protein n=1 Tax=Mytilus coruscus TaxID=42192 RepID=A0A6J8C0F8_MYTCO|nr:unnamed protein product [Mytilus coruscus]